MWFSIARELGYKQKFGHKLLRGEKTKTVAIVLSMQRLILEEQNQRLVLLLLDKFERGRICDISSDDCRE